MKNVVGPLFDGGAAWSMLALRDRGLTSGGSASLPPGSGRMLENVVWRLGCGLEVMILLTRGQVWSMYIHGTLRLANAGARGLCDRRWYTPPGETPRARIDPWKRYRDDGAVESSWEEEVKTQDQ